MQHVNSDSLRRTVQVVLATIVGLAILPDAAHAKKKPLPRHECRIAYKKAQALEASAHLREARDMLLACAKATCGRFLQHECSARYTRIDSDIPSIVPLALDETGAPLVDVKIEMDGEALASHLDGHALLVNPGLHEFSFNRQGSNPVFEKIMIVQGQRNRTISVSLQASASPPAPAPVPAAPVVQSAPPVVASAPPPAKVAATPAPEPAPAATPAPAPAPLSPSEDARVVTTVPPSNLPTILSFVLGGTGLVAVGTGALLTVWGRRDNKLLADCSPGCRPESVTHIRKLYIAADISFGVGAAALATSVWFLATRLASDDYSPASTNLGVAVQPTPSGAVAAVSGRF